MSSLILGWLANHWLLIAALVVGLAAIAQPVIVWKFKAWILLAVVLWWGWIGHAATNALQAKLDGQELQAAEQAAKASERARKIERDKAQAIAAIAAQHEQDKTDAKATADDIAAGLRAGNLKLRAHWQGCEATSRVSGAAASAGEPDADADLREADAAEAIGDAKRADDWIKSLQAVTQADRK